MTTIKIDKRRFLVKETPGQILNEIRDGVIRNMPVILNTKTGIVSIPTRILHDFILIAEINKTK